MEFSEELKKRTENYLAQVGLKDSGVSTEAFLNTLADLGRLFMGNVDQLPETSNKSKEFDTN